MQRSAYGLIVLLTLTTIPLSAGAAPAEADRQANCVASVDAITAEWRNLAHSSFLKPSQRIATGDGHWLAGSQVNYAHILIGRADNACGAGNAEQARDYVDEANKLLNPAPSGTMLATRPGN
jgi:CelD/BcsL family acetyltransferase involved in cellulose biosynthesis